MNRSLLTAMTLAAGLQPDLNPLGAVYLEPETGEPKAGNPSAASRPAPMSAADREGLEWGERVRLMEAEMCGLRSLNEQLASDLRASQQRVAGLEAERKAQQIAAHEDYVAGIRRAAVEAQAPIEEAQLATVLELLKAGQEKPAKMLGAALLERSQLVGQGAAVAPAAARTGTLIKLGTATEDAEKSSEADIAARVGAFGLNRDGTRKAAGQ